MDRFIPDDIVDKIREGVDIVSIVSEHIALKKSGQNYKGLCPFHSEKTPSFVVSPTKQIFHCFGCGAGGNVFHFLMKYDNLTFPQAIRYLGEKAGIRIPSAGKKEESASREREALYEANRLAMEYYCKNLEGSREAEGARIYLEKRGIEKETLQEFNIGYSLPQWDSAYRYLRQKGVDAAVLERTGLVIRREKGDGFYDRFRGRIIFPIFDLKKRVTAFGGRVIDDAQPKYINSPESPIYIKGENLYCLDKARQEMGKRGYLLVVEGYLDAIMAYQKGLRNISATLGTALTAGHLRLIKRFTNNLILVFDPDAPGKNAAIRSAPLFLENGMKVKVATLSEGTDPDTFLRKKGLESFVERLKNSEKLLDFVLREIKGKGDLSNIDEKLKVAEGFLPMIGRIPNRIERNFYIKRLSDELGIEEADILAELKNIPEKRVAKTEDAEGKTAARPRHLQKTASLPGDKAEEMLIHIMLNDSSIAKRVKDNLSLDDFRNPAFKGLAGIIYRAIDEGKELNSFFKAEDAHTANLFSALSVKELEYDNLEQSFYDCVKKIKEGGIKERMRDLQERLKIAEKNKDTELCRSILDDIKILKECN